MEKIVAWLVPMVAAVISLVFATLMEYAKSAGWFKKLNLSFYQTEVEKKSYSDRLGELSAGLTKASRQVDEVLSELAAVAKEREENVRGLEESLQLLERSEAAIKTRIEQLEKVPLPAVEHFAEIMNRGEKRSAKRDYMLFGAGVMVSTIVSIGLKVFGLG